jgi:Papain family cysteine protease
MLHYRTSGVSAVIAAMLVLALGTSAALAAHPGGAILSPPEVRQSIPQAPVFRDFLPAAVDLSQYMPPVGDQGQQGSCVGWATAYAARAYYAEQVEHRDTAAAANQPSPAWVYDIIHYGDADCDGGARIPDAMQVLQQGDYSLADFPYSDTSCARPALPERSKPTDFRIDSFEQVYDAQGDRDLDQIKGALAKGEPVVTLIILDPAFQDLSPTNKIWQSDDYQPSDGGHAITLVGYDDRSQTFKFINSWGTSWGDDGYAYVTYDSFVARTAEAYVMHMPGDPELTLSSADLDPPQLSPIPKDLPFNDRKNVSRDLAATDEVPIDVGQLSCGKVDIATDAQGNKIASGFVGTQAELDRVSELLKDKVDENDVTLAPWPACELKLTLAASLADTDTPQTSVDPSAPKVGDDLRVGIQSPGFASYLYAAYFAADGSVATLLQPGPDGLKPKPGHTRLSFGDAASGGVQLAVTKPVGDEMLVVLASEKPLFDTPLSGSVSNRRFLSDLRASLLSGEAGRVTATLVPVTTSE